MLIEHKRKASPNNELGGIIAAELDDEEDEKLQKAARLAKFAKTFANEHRMAVILSVLGSAERVTASDAWPSSVSRASRSNHLGGLREFLEIERPQKNQDAKYGVAPDNRERLQMVIDALETLADWAEADASPTLRVAFDDDGTCTVRTPEGVVKVERAQLLGALAVALESIQVPEQ